MNFIIKYTKYETCTMACICCGLLYILTLAFVNYDTICLSSTYISSINMYIHLSGDLIYVTSLYIYSVIDGHNASLKKCATSKSTHFQSLYYNEIISSQENMVFQYYFALRNSKTAFTKLDFSYTFYHNLKPAVKCNRLSTSFKYYMQIKNYFISLACNQYCDRRCSNIWVN